MVRLALFGAGRIGRIHAANIAANPRCTLAAVFDPAEANATALASATGAIVADTDTILSRPDIDGVLIGSPATSHAAQATAALRAGKAVLCEKPLSFDLAEARQVVAEVERSAAPCMMGFHRRFDRQFAAARANIAGGEAGRVFQLTISSRSAAVPPVEYVRTSGGLFRDQTIHDLDIARFLLGEDFVSLYAVGGCLVEPAIGAAGDIDTAMVTLESASGCQVHINNGRFSPSGYDQRVEVVGTRMAILIENRPADTLLRSTGSGFTTAPPEASFIERYADAYRAELDAFLDLIEGRTSGGASARDGLEAQRLAEAAGISLRTGAPVRLNGPDAP